jgi:MFS family permease
LIVREQRGLISEDSSAGMSQGTVSDSAAVPFDEHEWVGTLREELADYQPAAVGALLTATTLLRIGAVGTLIAVQFDLSDMAGGRPNGLTVGLIGAAQALSEMTFAPILARWADRVGRSRFLIGGPLVGMVGCLCIAFGMHPAQIGAARLVEGIGAAAFVPTALGTIAAATRRDSAYRARASGAFEAASLGGYAGGFALAPLAYAALHRGVFGLLAALYLAAAIVCWRLVPEVRPLPISPLRRVLRAVVGPGPMRAFLPAWVCTFALIGAFGTNLPALLRHHHVAGQTLTHHFDERIIGSILVAWVALFLVGIALWVPVVARRGPAIVMRRAVPGAWLVLAALFGINHLPLSLAPALLPALVGGFLVLAGFGPAAVTYLADCSEAFAADRSALMSFYTVTLAGGGAIGAVLGGLAARYLFIDGLVVLGFFLSLLAFTALTPVVRFERQARARSAAAAVSEAR